MADPKSVFRGHKVSLTRHKKVINDFDVSTAIDQVEAEKNPVLDEILGLENKLAEWDTELLKKESEQE
ncbi:unnamed protein product [Allacma fusca]|uniref:Uncharacterized protein n=1 Tax=Allacma fusca TaxID=39272 RepID=A0A8J2P2N9_9HEXA|nr:unnamed protein product [Allacma fusca]